MHTSELYRGDCCDIMRTLPPASVDAVITDPPYGTTDLSWDKPIDLDRFWIEVNRVAKETAVVVAFCAQPFTTRLINSNPKCFRYELVWEKARAVGFLDANKRPLRAHETLLIFVRKCKGSTYNAQKTPGKPYISKGCGVAQHYRNKKKIASVNLGDRHPRSVLRFTHDKRSLHPTQKPLELMRWIVASYTNAGDMVLDPYMGSGSTGEACQLLGRRFIGMERDEKHFATASARLAQPNQLRRAA